MSIPRFPHLCEPLTLRRTLKRLGVRFLTESAVRQWHGDGATVVNLLDGAEQHLACDTLVLATPNIAKTTLAEELMPYEIEVHQVGDCVAPRWAVHAIYEGRKLGRTL